MPEKTYNFQDFFTLVNRFSSAVSEKISLKASETTLVLPSDAGSPRISLSWLQNSQNCFNTNFMVSSSGLPELDDEVSRLDRKEAARPFMIQTINCFVNSNTILSIIPLIIISHRIWIIKIFWVRYKPYSQLIMGFCEEEPVW